MGKLLMLQVVEVGPEFPLRLAHEIRRKVFEEEQGIPVTVDIDEYDAEARHFLCLDNSSSEHPNLPIGTVRLRPENGCMRCERLAVLSDHRRKGAGEHLVSVAMAKARALGFKEAMIHAQVSAEKFWTKLFFVPVGEKFEEAGIPHIEMRRSL